ncbi:LOW QUALITY PROTEIN: translocator protein homolog [Rutidosis leptorrhynchoides]|uniref:LOW QUALITY PROTEIN: translocator protein homolog n=1 Tax=Rutidosis leptorrhynchoides TaxID=125765 RepID=UPI003A98CF6A
MESTTQELKHRTKDQQDQDHDLKTTQKNQRRTMPPRGIRSLAIGIAIPLVLTLANISMFGWNRSYRVTQKPFWIPPLWALHFTCLSSAFVMAMGLSAWLVWAEGGFHQNPNAILAYLGQLGFSLAWDPVFFKMGANRVGLLVCLGQMASMFYCYQLFGRVNRTAGDLVKLCLIWSGFLTLVNMYFVV